MSDYLFVVAEHVVDGALEKTRIEKEVREALPRSVLPRTRNQLRVEVSNRDDGVYLQPFVGCSSGLVQYLKKKRQESMREILRALTLVANRYSEKVSLLIYRDTGRRRPTIKEVVVDSIDRAFDALVVAGNTKYVISHSERSS